VSVHIVFTFESHLLMCMIITSYHLYSLSSNNALIFQSDGHLSFVTACTFKFCLTITLDIWI